MYKVMGCMQTCFHDTHAASIPTIVPVVHVAAQVLVSAKESCELGSGEPPSAHMAAITADMAALLQRTTDLEVSGELWLFQVVQG